MVKLIRLVSENDAQFKTNFDADIKLKAQAQIALHNLTFESDFEVLSVNPDNADVFTQLASYFDQTLSQLSGAEYKASNYYEFFDALQGKLNKTLFLPPTIISGDNGSNQIFSSYMVYSQRNGNESGKISIMWQATPLCMMFHRNVEIRVNDAGTAGSSLRSKADGVDQSLMYISQNNNQNPATRDTLVINTTETTEAEVLLNTGNLMSRTDTATQAYTRFVANKRPDYCLSNGNATFYTFLKLLVDRPGEPSEGHGYGMGLSWTDLSGVTSVAGALQTIPTGARDFELIIEKAADPYLFISPTTGSKDPSTLSPLNFAGISADHLFLDRDNGHIIASVWQADVAGGTRTVIFDYEIPSDKLHLPLYPYIYIKAANSKCIVGSPKITFDSLAIEENRDMDFLGGIQTMGGSNPAGDTGAWKNPMEYLSAYGNGAVWNNLALAVSQGTQYVDIEQTFQLTIHNDILRYLGFNRATYFGNKYSVLKYKPIDGLRPLAWGAVWKADNLFEIVNSDSYVVEVLNLPLQSYDGSVGIPYSDQNRGKRRNILGVIPINNNNGIVEYNANEALYIDINNAEPINITNMHIRILSKDLNPIETVGSSVITILLKD